MWWLVLWIAITVFGLLGAVASTNSIRFGRRVDRDVQQLWTRSPIAPHHDRQRLEGAPAPVQRYLRRALGRRELAVRTVRLQHGGTFRTSLDGSWLPIQGKQYFSSDPPGFVWWGRVRLAPGVWVDARDRSTGGVGNMFVSAESTVTLANSTGPELDQGALLRLLGEMMWFPTVFLDERYIGWSAIDDRRARATLRLNGREVAGTFEFGDDDLPTTFSAERYRDLGGGTSVLTPFSGQPSNYREIDGLLVPHQKVASWHVNGQAIPYVRFQVERLEFDATSAF